MITEKQKDQLCSFPLAQVIGENKRVPLLDGRSSRYVNLDNAASTPALASVGEGVNAFLEYYSSVHRGFGFKSQLSTHIYEEARHAVAEFFGTNLHERMVVFTQNTTEAINKLSYRLPTRSDQVVLSTLMEHHSNMLPWRLHQRWIYVDVLADGSLDMEDFQRKLREYGRRVRLVAISGASNVTGHIPDLHTIARWTHTAGAELLVDAAQLAPHRPICMGRLTDPERIDYLAISAHKMYAPFGSGALIAPHALLAQGIPEYVGGGQVKAVTPERIIWSNPPERDEAGSPNVVGVVALALALQALNNIGMEQIARHEVGLTAYALRRLAQIPRLTLYGDTNPECAVHRTGVISFNVDEKPGTLVASILSFESGIAVRCGSFCAHPYVLRLLKIDPEEYARKMDSVLSEDCRNRPGAVRISFGLYNTANDVDILVEALERIVKDQYAGEYILDAESGEYKPAGYDMNFDAYFSLT
ncbi:MAG: aminotransferase class V-fold PLP-dependent enzyme [Chloroflexi bacterium]|nr:aminotransferase class V-fold PLP-dependent enzyme [Chloroflexota bacterium]